MPKTKLSLNKITTRAGAVSNEASASVVAKPDAAVRDSVDGELNSSASNMGAEVRSTEESMQAGVGNVVPKL